MDKKIHFKYMRKDETSYLLSNKERAIRLQKAIYNLRNNLNIKYLTFDKLDEMEKKITIR
jgi:hypothetical protein